MIREEAMQRLLLHEDQTDSGRDVARQNARFGVGLRAGRSAAERQKENREE
jgi:hypothetical protein